MFHKQIVIQNLRYYRRYYLLIALAVALANTIITGSLLVGDSVKHTLLMRVDERLGQTVTLVTSGKGFMDDVFANTPPMDGSAATVLMTNGFVPAGMSLLPVIVWGVDSSLTAIASSGFVFPEAGEAVINRKFADELSLKAGDDLVVRLPNTHMIPSGSLFVTDNYTASLRLRIKAVIDGKQSGNLSLRNEQTIPFNLFINRGELTSELEMTGKCNIILLNRDVSGDEMTAAWKPKYSGIKSPGPTFQDPSPALSAEAGKGYREIISERVFLDKDLIARLDEHFPDANHLYSYLVNELSANKYSRNPNGADLNESRTAQTSTKLNPIPYSFITAIDRFAGRELSDNNIVLSDYAARRLNVSAGDTVTLSYFVSAGLKVLREEQYPFIVSDILPLQMFQADGRLSAEFPGLHDVDNCTDWDSDLPIDMDRITKEDENYWDLYRTTPKALIAYSQGALLWGNDYGVATSVRIVGNEDVTQVINRILSPADAGITVVAPRETGLAAARGGVDFKSLFLSLAFFVIAAALLLATIPLSGMLHDRLKELQLLQALGYTHKRIKNILVQEIAMITFAATLAGMFIALLYNHLTLFALGNIWKGAVHTENFIASIEPVSLMIGFFATVMISFVTLWRSLRRARPVRFFKPDRSLLRRTRFNRSLILCFLTLVLFIANFTMAQSPALFIATGIIGLLAAISGYASIISRRALKPRLFSRKAANDKNLYYRRRNGMISVAVLASGLFIVFSVGLNRKSFSDTSGLASGTGGFTLWGENSVPLYHSLSTAEGRTRFGLSELSEGTSILQFYRYAGDDASCLNLNKAPQPAVLGVDADRLADALFTFASKPKTRTVQPSTELNLNTWKSLSQKNGAYYPVIADQTVLQWGLMKSVGDTIIYINRKGEPVILQFIGGLNNSIFQGNLLMDKTFFSEIWGEDGSEVMLVQTPESSGQAVKQLLSQALANYGLQLSFCNDRLKEFNSVTDSYLTIFLMLGGLGLLIGLLGMLLVIRQGLLGRTKEVSTLLAIGFDTGFIKRQLFRESMIVPLYAIVSGTAAALVAVASAIPAVDLPTWMTMLAILASLIVIAWLYTKRTTEITNENIEIKKKSIPL